MQASISATISLAGERGTASETRTGDGVAAITPTIAPADAGTLTTRSSGTAGVITVTSTDLVTGDHGVLTWQDSDANNKHRYNVDLTVAGTAITFTGGTGDTLPAEDEAINISWQDESAITFDFDKMDTFCVTMNVRGVIVFLDATETEKCVVDMNAGGMAYWCKGAGFPAPMSGTPITHAVYGSGSTTAGTNFLPKVLALYDASVGSGQ